MRSAFCRRLFAVGVLPFFFFSNSTRRDPTEAESQAIAKVPGCTAFHVSNTSGKHLLITARHCFGYQATNWCKTGEFKKIDGETGKCLRLVAGDRQHDIALFEAGFQNPARATYSLAAQPAAVGTRLQMIGYPADVYRKGALTLTENCWVLKTGVQSPHSRKGIYDISSLHNCTTYGGNSGGPMIEEGTQVAIGLPFTYMPGDYTQRDPQNLQTSAHLAQMSDFVNTFRPTLVAEGVVIEE
ncbi:serine protease [bacterium]|nr:serine protease [bacterium]